jgi:hypothetical protein
LEAAIDIERKNKKDEGDDNMVKRFTSDVEIAELYDQCKSLVFDTMFEGYERMFI